MNALEELKEAIEYYDLPEIKEANISFGNTQKYLLKEDYTKKELSQFFIFLDREYDEGYGIQELFGYVIFMDDCMLTRAEYDGSEWWDCLDIK